MLIDFPSSCLGRSSIKYDVHMSARILYLLAYLDNQIRSFCPVYVKSATFYTFYFERCLKLHVSLILKIDLSVWLWRYSSRGKLPKTHSQKAFTESTCLSSSQGLNGAKYNKFSTNPQDFFFSTPGKKKKKKKKEDTSHLMTDLCVWDV